MATISFDEKVTVKDKKTVKQVTEYLDDSTPVAINRRSETPVCSSKIAISNAKKWTL